MFSRYFVCVVLLVALVSARAWDDWLSPLSMPFGVIGNMTVTGDGTRIYAMGSPTCIAYQVSSNSRQNFKVLVLDSFNFANWLSGSGGVANYQCLNPESDCLQTNNRPKSWSARINGAFYLLVNNKESSQKMLSVNIKFGC